MSIREKSDNLNVSLASGPMRLCPSLLRQATSCDSAKETSMLRIWDWLLENTRVVKAQEGLA